MTEQPPLANRDGYVVEVTGELPYYVPMPPNVALASNSLGTPHSQLQFQHFHPLRHPDDSQGEGVDDRLGTFIKSKVHVRFHTGATPSETERQAYEKKALDLTNKALTAIRYAASDHTITLVNNFQRTSIHVQRITADGKATPAGSFAEATPCGPFGIGLQRTLNQATVEHVCWIFNGLVPVNPAFLLILDAKYHNAVHDLLHAILDLATALEINIDILVNRYSSHDKALSQIDLESKNIYTFYDRTLRELTAHSLHDKPALFIDLEYIREIRNCIVHEWKAEFHISKGLKKSKYLAKHQARDGHAISDKEEVDRLIASSEEIIKFCDEAFMTKYGRVQNHRND